MLSDLTILVACSELYCNLCVLSDGFTDFIDEDYPLERLVADCNEKVFALNELIQELEKRNIIHEMDLDFDFDQYLN